MLFWITIIAIAVLSTLALIAPLWRPATDEETGHEDVALYRDQLAEVDRDLARGVLDETEAARTRTEIARRLLSADQAAGKVLGSGPLRLSRGSGAVMMLCTIGGAIAVYFALGAFDSTGPYRDMSRAQRIAAGDAMRADRMPQLEAEIAFGTEIAALGEIPEDYAAMIARLREIVPQNPEQREGWELLALHEARLGNFSAATRAQEQVLRLKGDAVTAADRLGLLDRMVAATNGFVSPEAEQIMLGLLDEDPRSVAARYYAGLLYAQTDRPDMAFQLWRDVLENGDPASIHYSLAESQIEAVAFAAGEEFTLESLTPRGPSADDIAAAAEMSAQDRSQMIAGMIEQLSTRLADEGGPASDWARLIVALSVIEETERAQMIWEEARTAFASQEADLATIAAAAQQAGLIE